MAWLFICPASLWMTFAMLTPVVSMLEYEPIIPSAEDLEFATIFDLEKSSDDFAKILSNMSFETSEKGLRNDDYLLLPQNLAETPLFSSTVLPRAQHNVTTSTPMLVTQFIQNTTIHTTLGLTIKSISISNTMPNTGSVLPLSNDLTVNVDVRLSFCDNITTVLPYQEIRHACNNLVPAVIEVLSDFCSEPKTRQKRYFFSLVVFSQFQDFFKNQKMTTISGEEVFVDRNLIEKYKSDTIKLVNLIISQTRRFSEGKIPVRLIKSFNEQIYSKVIIKKPFKCIVLQIQNDFSIIYKFSGENVKNQIDMFGN